jgi:hypothetical protein
MTPTLIKLSQMTSPLKPTPLLQKLAQGGYGSGNDPSVFDESVPPMQDQSQMQDPNSPMMTPGQQELEAGPADPNDLAAAIPMDQQATAADPGTMAAQNFIGPEVMQAAMNGDVNAANIIGAAAGHIARLASAPLTQPQVPGMDPSMAAAGAPPMPPAMTSPEDDLAATIAPLPQEVLQQVEGGGVAQGQPATQY